MTIIRRAAVLFVLLLALLAPAAPVAAEIDLRGLLVDPPEPGFVGFGAAEGGLDGPTTADGDPAPPGYVPPGSSGFLRGWGRTYIRQVNTGEVFVVGVAEMSTPGVASIAVANDVRNAVLEGAQEFDVEGIPGARAATTTESEDGTSFITHVISWPYGKYNLVVAGGAPAPGMDVERVKAVARAQHAKAASLLPAPPAGQAGAVDDAEDARAAFDLGVKAGKVFVMAAVAVLGVGVLVLVVWLVKRSSKPKPAPYAGWPPAQPTQPVAPMARWAPDDVSPASGPSWSPPPAPPAPSSEPSWEPPPAPAWSPPPAPATDAFAPSPFAPPAPAPAPEPAPAPAPVVTALPAQGCPKCGAEFGSGTACQACEAPRTMCAVCGTKIWAGALTCSEHSGTIR